MIVQKPQDNKGKGLPPIVMDGQVVEKDNFFGNRETAVPRGTDRTFFDEKTVLENRERVESLKKDGGKGEKRAPPECYY